MRGALFGQGYFHNNMFNMDYALSHLSFPVQRGTDLFSSLLQKNARFDIFTENNVAFIILCSFVLNEKVE